MNTTLAESSCKTAKTILEGIYGKQETHKLVGHSLYGRVRMVRNPRRRRICFRNQIIGYFAKYGPITALIFPIISMGILAYVMHIMLKFARLNGFTNYKDTYDALYPQPKMEILFDI